MQLAFALESSFGYAEVFLRPDALVRLRRSADR
jgi:hypothetical protein